MKYKILKTEEDYKAAVNYIEELGDLPNFEDNKELIEKFELVSMLIENFEKENYPVNHGNPIDIIKLKMEYLGLKQKDLSPNIASKGVISEMMNKKRGISKDVIRKLSELLKIDQEVLNIDYELKKETKKVSFRTKNKIPAKSNFSFDQNFWAYISKYQNNVMQNGMLLNICTNY